MSFPLFLLPLLAHLFVSIHLTKPLAPLNAKSLRRSPHRPPLQYYSIFIKVYKALEKLKQVFTKYEYSYRERIYYCNPSQLLKKICFKK